MAPSIIQQQVEMLNKTIEMQTKTCDITRRKIEAMHDARKATWRVLTCKIDKEREATTSNRELVAALIELRRADSAVRTSEVEQVELYHVVELENLQLMKEQLEKVANPSPLVGVQLTRRIKN